MNGCKWFIEIKMMSINTVCNALLWILGVHEFKTFEKLNQSVLKYYIQYLHKYKSYYTITTNSETSQIETLNSTNSLNFGSPTKRWLPEKKNFSL